MSDKIEVTMASRAESRAALAVAKGDVRDGRFWKIPLADDDAPPADVHTKLIPWADTLWTAWKPLRQRDREHDALYENRELRMVGTGRTAGAMRWLESVGFDTSSLFVTTGIVDTFQARMIRRKTMPMFVVDDAEWSLKSQAQEFRRWLHGKLKESEFEAMYPEFVFDALTRGDALAYIDEGEDDVFIDRVHRSEILIDPAEARMGANAVRTMIRYRVVSRDSLIERFPKLEKEILVCPEATIDRTEEYGTDILCNEREIGQRDMVELCEAWHPPARQPMPDQPCDGRMTVCIRNATLCYKEWRDVGFPFARLSWFKPRGRGFWGTGVVERLRKIQMGINRLMSDIDKNVAVTGKGIWMVPEQFDAPVSMFSSDRPFKYTYKGPRPPEFVHPIPFSQQALALLQFKIDQAHNLVGSAQWSAQGRSPLGAGASGVAIDTMEDLLSDRHANPEEHCGVFRIDVAQCLLDAAGRVAERMEEEVYEYEDDDDDEEGAPTKKTKKRKKPYVSTWMDKGILERLDWHTVSMTRQQYRLQLEPVGFMPSTRAGKLAATAELIKVGAIQQNQAADLYDEPDLAHVNRLELALRHNNERMCEQVGMLNKPMPRPSEYHDLTGLLTMCKQYYNRAENEMDPVKHASERQLVLLRFMDFGAAIIALQDTLARKDAEKAAQMRRDAEAALPPPPGADQGAPMGAGAPPGPDMGAPPPGAMPPMMPPGAAAPPMA